MLLPYVFHLKVCCVSRDCEAEALIIHESVFGEGVKAWKISLPRVLTSICTKFKRCDVQDVLEQLSFYGLLHDDVSLFNWKKFCARQMISLLKEHFRSSRSIALKDKICLIYDVFDNIPLCSLETCYIQPCEAIESFTVQIFVSFLHTSASSFTASNQMK